jgi:hypothetical protein
MDYPALNLVLRSADLPIMFGPQCGGDPSVEQLEKAIRDAFSPEARAKGDSIFAGMVEHYMTVFKDSKTAADEMVKFVCYNKESALPEEMRSYYQAVVDREQKKS